MSSAAAKPSVVPRKSIKVTTALEGNLHDYKPYCVEFLEKHPSSILKAALHAINCHTADMFLIMLTILSDKYGHDFDEMLQCIKLDERWLNALGHPLIKSMSYFDQEDLENVVAANERAIGVKQPASTPTEELEAAETTVKVKKSRKAKPAAEEAPAAAEPVVEEEPPKPAKKSSKKKAAEAVVEEVPEVVEEPPKPAKKSSKKKAAEAVVEEAATEAVAPAEEAPKPAKKSSSKKKAAAAAEPEPEVDELVAAVSGISLDADEDSAPATKPKAKKVISKKPAKA